jgi:hypothetical protein
MAPTALFHLRRKNTEEDFNSEKQINLHCWLLSSFKLSLTEFSEIKVSAIKLGSGTSDK